jgi:malate synthase
MESHLEARLWNDVFIAAQEALGIPTGTIKATVLIETIMAAFEMDEILYELKDHSAGLNCGRWDYIFSFIKRFKNVPGYLFPGPGPDHHDPPLHAVPIPCWPSRPATAAGPMPSAAWPPRFPSRTTRRKTARPWIKVRADKTREATDGHDGTWVAHPGLVPIAMEEFDKAMPAPNQIDRLREDVQVETADLLKLPAGTITEAGMRTNISVGIQYMANWLSGLGCVPLYHLMEDAATAEISRAQLWQWINHPDAALDDGRKITLDLFRAMVEEEMEKIRTRWAKQSLTRSSMCRPPACSTTSSPPTPWRNFLTLAYDIWRVNISRGN